MNRSKALSAALLGLILFINISTGLIGVNFGFHWDEWEEIIPARSMVENGVVYPGKYHYPSLLHDLCAATLVFDTLQYAIGPHHATPEPLRAHLVAAMSRDSFKIRMRCLMILLSSLSIIWVYGTVIAWRRRRPEALLAATLMGLSWEFAYHSRWMTVDPLMTQFGALTVMLLAFSLSSERSKLFRRLGAVAAGMAFASKYPGGVMLAYVLTHLALFRHKVADHPPLFKEAMTLGAIFTLTFLIITPGAILDSSTFISHLRLMSNHYWNASSGWHNQYIIERGWPHLRMLLEYYIRRLLSPMPAISLFFFISVVLGAIFLIREDKRRGLLFIGFPIMFTLYFSLQRLILVRNVLLVLPFFAVMAARGNGSLQQKLGRLKALRPALPVVLVALVTINTFWLYRAAFSIRFPWRFNKIVQVSDYVAHHPNIKFLISHDLAAQFEKKGILFSSNIVRDSATSFDEVIFDSSETPNWQDNGKTVWADDLVTWFGPYEVDLGYYPGWKGASHVVVLTKEYFQRIFNSSKSAIFSTSP